MQRTPSGRTERTMSTSTSLPLRSSSVSSSYALSKWSSMARLLRPVTKIISVMPAAAASSTAYWISGLSTIGSISFGLALVTGRNRLPRPATGNTAFLSLACMGPILFFSGSKGLQQVGELFLVQHGDAQLAGLVELAARVFAGHPVVGLLRHRAGHLVPFRFDRGLGVVAAHAGERPGQHERLRVFRRPGRAFPAKADAVLRIGEAPDDVPIMRLADEFLDAFHQLGTDSFQRDVQRRLAALLALGILLADRLLVCRCRGPIGLHEGVERPAMACGGLCHFLADAGDA